MSLYQDSKTASIKTLFFFIFVFNFFLSLLNLRIEFNNQKLELS